MVISEVEVVGAGNDGIGVHGSTSIEVINSYVHESRYGELYIVGALVTPPAASTITSSVTLESNYTANANMPVDSAGNPVDSIDIDRMTSNVTVDSNTVLDGDIILYDDVENFAVVSGTTIYGSSGHVVTSNTIGVGADPSTSNGIDISGLETGFYIYGNIITSPAKFGIIVNGPAGGTSASNIGTIQNNTLTGTFAYDGIYTENAILMAKCGNPPCSGMQCTNLDKPPEYLYFYKNDLSGATIPGSDYYIELAGTLTSSTIDHNHCVGGVICAVTLNEVGLTCIDSGVHVNGMSEGSTC